MILVLATTLSAGLPAYWLTRTQLEQQLWSQVNAARHASYSLFEARKEQLVVTTILFSERPTLRRLLSAGASSELQAYMQAFQNQSQLDLLFVCDSSHSLLGETGNGACPPLRPTGFTVLDSRPVLLASQPVYEQGRQLGTAVAGVWLDQDFLRQLAANTGSQQTVLSSDGVRLASSLPLSASVSSSAGSWALDDRRQIHLDGEYYYAAYLSLTGPEQTPVLVEVAVPAGDLIATERRASLILVASTGLVALLGVMLGGWTIRRLTAPLQTLTQVSDRISRGEFLTDIPILDGPVEVSTLATALNKSQAAMIHALDERSQAGNWLKALLQSFVEGVVTFDHTGRITFFTQGAEVMTGWPAMEALGQTVDLVFPLADSPDDSFTRRIPPSGKKQVIEIINRYGRRVALAVTGARLVPPDNDTVQVALVLRDVTEEEARSHLRSYFLANISHEFRTPLSTLNASIELLLEEVDDLTAAEIKELLRPTHLSLLSLQTLIDNLLESSKIEAGHFTIRLQPANLNQVITDALHIVKPLLERRGQPLTLTEAPHLPRVEADPPRLVQVLVNLLANASKYSPIGRPIELVVEQRPSAVRVSILDRGPGIPLSERLNLFRRFVRLDSQQHDQYGIGLGLYVVKTTIDAHGGAVGVDDRAGGGSVFWFELPLKITGKADL